MSNEGQALIGIADIARMAGVSRQRAQALAKKDGFPEPAAVTTGGRFWRQGEVRDWIAEWRKTWPPRREEAEPT